MMVSRISILDNTQTVQSNYSQNRYDPRIQSLVGKTICNHQKFEITFKCKNVSILCDLIKEGLSYTDIPLFVNGDPEQLRLNSPFSYTFEPNRNFVLLQNYGLSGGMRGPHEIDKETEKKHLLKIKIVEKVVKLGIKIAVVVILIKGGPAGWVIARKLMGLP